MERFAQLLNLVCIGGLGYFLYVLWFLEVKAEPTPYWSFASGEAGSENTAAMGMFFVGIFVGLLVIFLAYFFIKLGYNIFAGFLAKIFPESLLPLVNVVILLAVLGCCFLGKESVKMTALNINCQIDEVFSLGKPITPEIQNK